jgi:Flp pilus assembly protein TadB
LIAIVLLVIIVITISFIYFSKYKEYSSEIHIIDKKALPLKQILPVGLAIIDFINYRFKSKYDERHRRKLSELYGETKANLYLRIYMANNICLVLFIVIIVLFFGTMLWTQEYFENNNIHLANLKGNRLQRPDFGDGDKIVEVNAQLSKGNVAEIYSYNILLKELPPTNDKQAVERVWHILNEEMIKGKNSQINNVTAPLSLKDTYEVFSGWDVKIHWSTSDASVLKSDGSIVSPQKGQSPKLVILTANISKNKTKLSKRFDVIVKPQVQSKEEKQIENAKKEIDRVIKSTADINRAEEVIHLPTELDDYKDVKINWTDAGHDSSPSKQSSGLGYIIFALVAGAAAIFLQEHEITNRVAVRHRKLQYEFPVFLTKLLLLINAGMTINKAWEKIVSESSTNTPLYKELNSTVMEIKGGIPEYQAYERFAQRCRVPEISKFASIIIQNLRKGNSELVQLLKIQSMECWEARKNLAKRLGEEASTKLLLPMVLMLLGILIIVSTPALLAINSF